MTIAIVPWVDPSPATAAPIGLISFDSFIPGPDGVNAFNISNFTGLFSLDPDFPVSDSLTLLSATLTTIAEDGSATLFELSDAGPGFLDGLLFADTAAFLSATFTATLSSVSFLLADGTTFLAASDVVSVNLLPSAGTLLSVGDFAVIDVQASAPPPTSKVPEPSTLLLVASGVLVGVCLGRRVSRSA
jgi:hypothetical protein